MNKEQKLAIAKKVSIQIAEAAEADNDLVLELLMHTISSSLVASVTSVEGGDSTEERLNGLFEKLGGMTRDNLGKFMQSPGFILVKMIDKVKRRAESA